MRGKIVAGKYRLHLPLGSGGMAEVWSATNTFTERQVAIKFLSQRVGTTSEHAARFLKEAKVSARINHPNIIDVLDVGQTEEGQLFLVMELLTGMSLDTALRWQTPPMRMDELVRIMIDVADALSAAHKAGIVHRDLKPTNIFLHTGGSTKGQLVPKVLDFGVSKFLEEDSDAALTVAGTVLGSPLYMSPEQARGELNVDGRTDIFAFGAILFEALCGYRPYDAKSVNALIVKIATTKPKDIDVCAPHAPESIRRVVRACMETDREVRARSFEEVLVGMRLALVDLEASPLRLPSPLIPAAVADPDGTNARPVVRGSERAPAETAGATPELYGIHDTIPSVGPPAHVSSSFPPGTVSIPPPAVGSSGSIPPPAVGSSGSSWTPNASYASVSVPPPPRRNAGLLVAAGAALVAAGIVIGASVADRPRADATAMTRAMAATTAAAAEATSTPTATPAEPASTSANEPPTVSVDALPGSTSPVARGSGRLALTASPGRCTIVVEGKDRGVTPITALDLAPGTHQITCRTPEGKERTASITVRDGAFTKHRFELDD
jgi:serine/threonine-protein kinase